MVDDKKQDDHKFAVAMLIFVAFVLGAILNGGARDSQINSQQAQITALSSNLTSCNANIVTYQDKLSNNLASTCPAQDCYAKSYNDAEAKCRYEEQCQWHGFVKSSLCDRSCGTGMHVKNVICEPN